jgi:hypothetical protein
MLNIRRHNASETGSDSFFRSGLNRVGFSFLSPEEKADAVSETLCFLCKI